MKHNNIIISIGSNLNGHMNTSKNVMDTVFNYLSKYHFKTNEFIKLCKMPLLIFHGTKDEVIYYGSSVKLQKYFKPTDRLFSIEEEKHRPIIDNPLYIKELERFLLNNEL